MRQIIRRMDVTVPVRAKVEGSWVTIGTRMATVDIEIDMDQVAQLAMVSAKNKSRKSKSGPCYARVTRMTETKAV